LIDPNSGRISGTISIAGPFDPDEQLRMALRFYETGGLVDQSDVTIGRVPSLAAAYFNGHSISFAYTELFVGAYNIEIFSGSGSGRHVWYTSLPVQAGTNGAVAVSNGTFSFTGAAPYGSASGTVALTGNWPTGHKVFFGFERVGGDGTLFRWPVQETEADGGELPFDIGGLAFGDYELGLYSADAQGTVTKHGTLAQPVMPRLAAPAQPGQDFTADFGATL
jgi:hypothetical protein